MKKLFVIESPRKIGLLSSILKEIGEDYSIAATSGRLFDIHPVDPYDFLRTGRVIWKPINQSRIEYLQKKIANSDTVVVATDSDTEGEVIAWHIQRIAENAGTPVERANIRSVTKKGIKDALKTLRDININKAEGGVARRIFDNFSQFSIDEESASRQPYKKGSVSRIVSPVIKEIERRPITETVLKKSLNGSDVDIYAKIPANLNQDKAIDKIKSLPRPFLSKTKVETLQISPLSMTDAVKMAGDALGIKPNEGYQSLERLFDQGRVSYFRTDSRRVSMDSISSMKKTLKELTGKPYSIYKEEINDPVDRSQDAHEALIPLRMTSNPFENIRKKGVDDQMESILWRHYSLFLDRAQVVKASRDLDCSAVESNGWQRLRDMGVELEFSRSHVFFANQKKSWDPLIDPIGIPAPGKKNDGSNVTLVGKDSANAVFERMVDLGIGRPSTICHHAESITQRFVSNGVTNRRAHIALDEARKVAPNLLSFQNAVEIESILHEPSEETVTDKVAESLEKSGWIKEDPGIKKKKKVRRNFSQSFEI